MCDKQQMASEDKWWLIFWGIVAVPVTIAIIGYTFSYCYTTRLFVEGGYSMKSVPGQQSAQWSKP